MRICVCFYDSVSSPLLPLDYDEELGTFNTAGIAYTLGTSTIVPDIGSGLPVCEANVREDGTLDDEYPIAHILRVGPNQLVERVPAGLDGFPRCIAYDMRRSTFVAPRRLDLNYRWQYNDVTQTLRVFIRKESFEPFQQSRGGWLLPNAIMRLTRRPDIVGIGTTGSRQLKLNTTTGVAANMPIAGTGVPVGTTVTRLGGEQIVTLSSALTQNAAGTYVVGAATFTLPEEGKPGSARLRFTTTANISAGDRVVGVGVPSGTTVTAVDAAAGAVTLSNTLTQQATGQYHVKGRSFDLPDDVGKPTQNLLRLASTTGINVNARIAGAGVPSGAVITAVDSETKTVTLSAALTQQATGRYIVGGTAVDMVAVPAPGNQRTFVGFPDVYTVPLEIRNFASNETEEALKQGTLYASLAGGSAAGMWLWGGMFNPMVFGAAAVITAASFAAGCIVGKIMHVDGYSMLLDLKYLDGHDPDKRFRNKLSTCNVDTSKAQTGAIVGAVVGGALTGGAGVALGAAAGALIGDAIQDAEDAGRDSEFMLQIPRSLAPSQCRLAPGLLYYTRMRRGVVPQVVGDAIRVRVPQDEQSTVDCFFCDEQTMMDLALRNVDEADELNTHATPIIARNMHGAKYWQNWESVKVGKNMTNQYLHTVQ